MGPKNPFTPIGGEKFERESGTIKPAENLKRAPKGNPPKGVKDGGEN